MKSMNKHLFISAVCIAFLLCAVLPPKATGDYYIVYGNVYEWNSYKQKYYPVNGMTVKLVCTTGTYYDTTHYHWYHGNGFYDFMASEVGRPESGTVSVVYEGCTFSQSFTEDDIPANRDFYLDAVC